MAQDPRKVRVEAAKDVRHLRLDLVISGPFRHAVLRPTDFMSPGKPPEEMDRDEVALFSIRSDDAPEFVRQLVEAFSQAGVQVPSAAAEIRRMEDHLRDMRRIAMREVRAGSSGGED